MHNLASKTTHGKRGAYLASSCVLMCAALLLLYPAQTATMQPAATLTSSTTPTAEDAAREQQITDWLSQMTLEEKVQFLLGDDEFSSRGSTRLGIPGIKMADSPQGVRAGGTAATMFLAPVTMAATWDTDLIERVGNALGTELRAKGSDMLLGPCVNIHRSPLGGRLDSAVMSSCVRAAWTCKSPMCFRRRATSCSATPAPPTGGSPR